LRRRLAAGILDEDTAHGLGGGEEEVAAAGPGPGLFRVNQPQIGLMDQGRGLERLPGLFLGQLLGSQLAQFLVDQGQEFPGGGRVASFDGGQDAGNLTHRVFSPNQGDRR
jgi:hypothetical protein